MRNATICAAVLLTVSAAAAGSKDKLPKVSYREMQLEMRDAFNCGLVVEKHLHGRLKDDADGYAKEREAYHCDHVEQVLSTLDDQPAAPPPQQ